jgi:hypothetical protein
MSEHSESDQLKEVIDWLMQLTDELGRIICDYLKEGPGVQIDDAITAAGCLAGAFFLRCGGMDLSAGNPGDFVSSNIVKEGTAFLTRSMVSFGESLASIGGASWDSEIPEGYQPTRNPFDLVNDLETPFTLVFNRFHVAKEVRPVAASFLTARFVKMAEDIIDLDLAKALALSAVAAGLTRVPNHLGKGRIDLFKPIGRQIIGERVPLPFGFGVGERFEDLEMFQWELGGLLERCLDASVRLTRPKAYFTGSSASFLSPCIYQPSGHSFDKSGAYTTDVQVEIYAPEIALKFYEEADASVLNRQITSWTTPWIIEGTKEEPKYMLFLNYANGVGFYDKFPQFGEFAWRWGMRLRRPGGVHVYLLTETDRDAMIPEEIGSSIEAYSWRWVEAVPRPQQPASSPTFPPMRIQTLSFRTRATKAPEILEALKARADDPWSLRDHDYYGAYLLSLSSGGRSWRRLLQITWA